MLRQGFVWVAELVRVRIYEVSRSPRLPQQQGIASCPVRVGPKNDISSKTVWVHNRSLTYWLLPEQRLPADIDPPDPDIPSLEPWLSPLRAHILPDPLAPDSDED